MMMANGQEAADEILGQSSDAAFDDDRRWFEANVGRKFRIRDTIPFEYNYPIGSPPQGMSWRTLVSEVEPDVRLRSLVAFPNEVSIEGVDDRHLEPLFKRAMERPR
jgi:hypothetical protein